MDGPRTLAMPLIGLGTWQAPKGEVGAAVSAALACGYRHIDAAAVYGNEAEVGEAIGGALEGGLPRSELFVTSKLFNSEHDPANVRAACEATLADLKLDYLDLYLIHWPQQFEKCADTNFPAGNVAFPREADGSIRYARVPLADTWAAMEALVDAGLARAIGVSNFNVKQLRSVCEGARIKPACNQVESHPFFAQTEMHATCRELGVVMTAYAPLGTGKAFDGATVPTHPVITSIGEKHGCSGAQVAIAFQLCRGVPTFPKSVSSARVAENLRAAEITLDDDDRARLQALDRGFAGRSNWGGPWVERDGRSEPRDLAHPDYPWEVDGTER